MGDTYSYALVRAIPDARRGEWVNIGLVVFLPDRLDIRIAPDLGKLSALAPTFPVDEVPGVAPFWEQIVKDLDPTERHDALSRLPKLRASQLAWFISSAEDYERNVAAIMTDLVIPKPARRPIRSAQNKPSLLDEIRAELRNLHRYSSKVEDIEKGMVVSRYPLPLVGQQGLYADLARKNGALYIAEVVDLRLKDDETALQRAAFKALAIERARDALQKDNSPLVEMVAFTAPAGTDRDHGACMELLRATTDKLYDFRKSNDRADFFNRLIARVDETEPPPLHLE